MTEQQEKLLDELLEQESGLSGKEMDFLGDLDTKWRERELTEKQAEWLEAIGERRL